MHTRAIEPALALAAESLNLEPTLSDLVSQAYGLTPAEIDLMWQTAPSRMPISRLVKRPSRWPRTDGTLAKNAY